MNVNTTHTTSQKYHKPKEMSPDTSDSHPSPNPNSSPTVSRHPCITCQKRKVRCDRKKPCTRCLKSGQECKQPEVFRPPRRPRRVQEANVLDRVRQLEDSLEQMRSIVARAPNASSTEGSAGDGVDVEPLEDSLGRLIVEEERSRYVSGSAWANLADQVGDLRTLLEDGDANDEELSGNSMQYLTEGIFPHKGAALKLNYSQTGLSFLWQSYVRYVDPVMKVFHIPSMQQVIDGILSNSQPTTKSSEALLAAIKFCAITSLSDDDCWSNFSTSRETLLEMFRSEVQATLNAANFLTSHDLITLQAFVIFLFCNRRREQPRAMWVSCGIAIRLAQSIGLHRDGAAMRLPVLATEIRRRLYWEIKMLDVGCAEDCGFLPTHIFGADTKIPINCNDSDIHPGDITPPAEREGFTDMTYVMIRAEMTHRLHTFAPHTGGRSSMGILTGDTQQSPEQSKAVSDFQLLLKNKYLQQCDISNPFQRVTYYVGSTILGKMSLIANYPMFHSSNRSVPISDEVKEALFNTSCEILENTDKAINDPETRGWSWMLQTYVHWHPVAYILNELRTTPAHHGSTRAWRAIEIAYSNPHGLTFEANLSIWRPLRGLLERAKLAREKAGLDMYVQYVTPSGSSAYTNITALPMVSPGVVEPRFSPEEGLMPSDESLMALDLSTPFATMADFMTGVPMRYDGSQDWWMGGNMTMPNDMNLTMGGQQG